MDTDDLSNETYKAIITTSAKFHDDLTLQFGLLSYECKTDDEFLDKSKLLINNWLQNSDLDELIWDIFFEDHPKINDFKRILSKILTNIEKVKSIPIYKRTFEF